MTWIQRSKGESLSRSLKPNEQSSCFKLGVKQIISTPFQVDVVMFQVEATETYFVKLLLKFHIENH